MKGKLIPYIAIAALGLVLLAYSMQTKKAELGSEWMDYQSAVSMSEKTGKKIFLFIFSPTCPKCRYFESEVFSKKDVMERISEKYVPSYVDASKEVPPVSVVFVPTFCTGYPGKLTCFQASGESDLLEKLGLS